MSTADPAATILLVEDDAPTRTFLADNLTADGYELLVADCARDGLRLLETKFPDVALVDLGLPDGSGLEIVRRVRASDGVASRIDPAVPLVVLSGRAGELDRLRGFERCARRTLCMSTTKPRYAGYVRVSKVGTREIDDLRSPDIQRRAIEGLAEREGFDVEWLNPQVNVSGAKADRQVLMDAVDRVERGELAGIAVAKLDRLSRLAPRQRIELFERIEGDRGEKPGRVRSATEHHDPTTARGRWMRDQFLGLARLQWEEAQEGFASAVEVAIGNGCHAHAPFGYRKPARDDGRVARGKPLVVVSAEAEVVHELFGRRARGVSWSELARWADTTGVPPRRGERWTRRAIENIVHNRAYLGEARYGEHAQPGAHDAIVTIDEFETANAARGVRPPRGEAALLSGLVRCAGCRHRMHAAVVGQRKQLVYRCKGHHGAGDCTAPAAVTRSLLDDLVTELFLNRYGDVEVKGHPADSGLADATDAVAAAERGLEQYLAAIDIDDVGPDAFKAGARERRQRVEDAQRTLHRARSRAGGLDLGPKASRCGRT